MNYKVDQTRVRPNSSLFYKLIPQNGAFSIGDTIASFHERQDAILVQNGKVVDVASNITKSITMDKKTFPHLKKGLFSKKVKGYVLLAFRGVIGSDVFTPTPSIHKDGFYIDEWDNEYCLELLVALSNITYNHKRIVENFDSVNESGPMPFNLYKWMNTSGLSIFMDEWNKKIKENPHLAKCALDREKRTFAPRNYGQVPIGILDVFDAFDKRIGDMLRNNIGINTYVRVELEDDSNGNNLKPL